MTGCDGRGHQLVDGADRVLEGLARGVPKETSRVGRNRCDYLARTQQTCSQGDSESFHDAGRTGRLGGQSQGGTGGELFADFTLTEGLLLWRVHDQSVVNTHDLQVDDVVAQERYLVQSLLDLEEEGTEGKETGGDREGGCPVVVQTGVS